MLKGKKFDASALPRPRYACIPTEMSIRSDRNAPTCQHQQPIIHY